MGAPNGSDFLPLFVILGWLELITSWFLKRAGELEVLLKLGLEKTNLEFFSVALTSLGAEPSLLIPLTFLGVRKMRAQLRAASVTLAFRSTVWSGLKMYYMITASAVTSRFIGPMTTGVIFGTNRLINIFCVKIPLVA